MENKYGCLADKKYVVCNGLVFLSTPLGVVVWCGKEKSKDIDYVKEIKKLFNKKYPEYKLIKRNNKFVLEVA